MLAKGKVRPDELGIYGKSLCFPLNSVANLKIILKKNLFEKQIKKLKLKINLVYYTSESLDHEFCQYITD